MYIFIYNILYAIQSSLDHLNHRSGTPALGSFPSLYYKLKLSQVSKVNDFAFENALSVPENDIPFVFLFESS